jgi:uncharacterized protein (DUF4415 family)
MYLNHASMNKTKTETDWKRILAYKEGERIPYEPGDGPYDPNDAEAARAWLAQADLIHGGKVVRRGKRGPQKAPTKKLVSLRLSAEVVEHFKSTGPGWQMRIDGALLESIKKSGSYNRYPKPKEVPKTPRPSVQRS